MPKLDRRALIGSLVTGGLASVILLQNQSEPASASVSLGSFEIDNNSVTTDSGEIQDVLINVAGNWRYAINHGDPERWQVTLSVQKENEWATVESTSNAISYTTYQGDYSISGSVIDTKLYNKHTFAVEDRGETKEVDLPFQILFEVLNVNNKVLASAVIEETATVEVSRKAFDASLYGDVSGDGEIVIETESG